MHKVHTTGRSRTATRRASGAHVVAALVISAVLAVCCAWTSPPTVAAATAQQAPAAAASLPDPGAAEADFVARINQLRSARGLATLSIDPELTAQARHWAATMAGEGRIFHAGDLSSGISANWQKLGENVGVGGDVGTLVQAFVDSPSHYANLVDPAYTRLGVGVVVSGDRLYTAHRFMALAPAPPPPPPTTAPPTTAAPAPTTSTVPATAPPATTTTTTAAPDQVSKLGPIDRIAELIVQPEVASGPT